MDATARILQWGGGMRLIDADRLLSERMKSKYYHLPNGDIAIPLIDIEHAPTVGTGSWIPITDALPQANEEVLITLSSGDIITIGWINKDGEWLIYEGDGNADINDILAWQPLPEPYREHSMMTLNDAITHAEEVAEAVCGECAKEHQQLAEWLKELRERRSSQLEPHWISVSERLPEKVIKSYWCCLDDGYQCQCLWTDDIGFGSHGLWRWCGKPQYSVIVAWMPLPKSYKGEKE